MDKKKVKPVKRSKPKVLPKKERLYSHTEVLYILNEFYWLMRRNNNSATKAFNYGESLKSRKVFKPSVGELTHSEVQ